MNYLLPVSLAVVFTVGSAQILIQGEPVQLLGGRTDADLTRKDVKESLKDIVDFATASLAAKKNAAVELVDVVKVQTQIVAGKKYFLTIQIKPAGCYDQCKYEQCDLTILDVVWEKKREVEHSACAEVAPPSPHVVLGGEKTTLDEPDVLKAAKFAVKQINMKSNSFFMASFLKLEHATKQVVKGIKYKLDFVLGDSVCRNTPDQKDDLKACPLSDPHKTQRCSAVVLFAAWETPKYTLASSHCDPKQSATEAPLLGKDGHDECHGGMFREFQAKYGKVYESQEEGKRFKIFCENVKKAKEYQANDQGSARYGITKFSDLTESEFRAYRYLSKPWDLSPMADMKVAPPVGTGYPESFDWRDHGAVTSVKNQGSCGSCWAFSTTGNVEGIWYKNKGKLVSLSEQELVDCDKVDQGCEGGLPANAYKQIINLGGLETEKEYKYTGRDGKCHFVKSEARVYINSSVAISSDEDEMAAWLAKNGPISIGINAFAMQFYMGGISHPWKIFCNPSSLDHGVLIVGYGKKGSEPYWIIKNSWGPDWGEKGYYYVYRGSGVCGLNRACTSAIIHP